MSTLSASPPPTLAKEMSLAALRRVSHSGWVFYTADDIGLDPTKCGKWMYFFASRSFVARVCERAVATGVVVEAKHSDASRGVACFYLNNDDLGAHRRVIAFFLENGLIQRTRTGRLYDISFKLDTQTTSGEYGADFHSDIRLSNFVDLTTGEWIISQPG